MYKSQLSYITYLNFQQRKATEFQIHKWSVEVTWFYSFGYLAPKKIKNFCSKHIVCINKVWLCMKFLGGVWFNHVEFFQFSRDLTQWQIFIIKCFCTLPFTTLRFCFCLKTSKLDFIKPQFCEHHRKCYLILDVRAWISTTVTALHTFQDLFRLKHDFSKRHHQIFGNLPN